MCHVLSVKPSSYTNGVVAISASSRYIATIASYYLKPLTVKVKNVMVMSVCMQS